MLDAARAQGYEAYCYRDGGEETFPEIESRGATAVYWLSLGDLSRLIEMFQREGVRRAVMAGQVKHKQIFSEHPARLETGEASAFTDYTEYRFAVGRGREGFGR